jgi:putative SOS response-associated peptidase YedK
MALAGLWETWRSKDGERIRSFAIVTTTPNELCAELHNRMPVVLAPQAWPTRLGEEPAELPELKALLAPYPSDEMIAWPVSPRRQRQKQRSEPDRPGCSAVSRVLRML